MNLKLILAAVCLGGSALALEENFSKVNESGFAPGWEAQSIDWAVMQGALHANAGMEKSFAFPTNLAAGAEVTAEVTVNVAQRTTKTGWAVAALVIRLDEKNYWQLGLCETPT